ncbi:MAG: DUF393 domain-containing protein, partial [Elusimicrobia bacterium]|nr:DUF393 domain-containing protein [Elusimicrobiota bacterium]
MDEARRRVTLLFDGDCGFCRFWARRWAMKADGAIDERPFQTSLQDFPQIDPAEAARAVQLVFPDGSSVSGAEAVFATMAAGGLEWPGTVYARSAIVRRVCDVGYDFVSARRPLFSRLTRLFWGADPTPSTYRQGTDLFLRALGAVYAVAFGSLWGQITGLIGSDGILPADRFLAAAHSHLGALSGWYVPTIFWLSSTDAALRYVCILGTSAGAAIALLGG